MPPALSGVVHADVRVGHARWHVATAGDPGAPPLVLLHGWPQHWWLWRHAIGPLAETHRVYVPDLRGFGWSDAPPGGYSKMGLAADVVRLLDVLGLERTALVGHDWGGFVAFLAALREPERIERLVALSIPHPWMTLGPTDPVALARTAAYQLPLATPRLGPALAQHVPTFLRTVLRAGVAPGFRWDAETMALYVDAVRRPDHARASSALYRTFLARELRALTQGRYANRRLEMPVLLATGELDPVVTPARLHGLTTHAPNGRTTVVRGAGHFLPEEAPDRVLELISLSRKHAEGVDIRGEGIA